MKRRRSFKEKKEVFYKRRFQSKNSNERVIHNDDTYYSRHEFTFHLIIHLTSHLTFHFIIHLTFHFTTHFIFHLSFHLICVFISILENWNSIHSSIRMNLYDVQFTRNFIHENMSLRRKKILLRSRSTQ